jgi:hypothetical protein
MKHLLLVFLFASGLAAQVANPVPGLPGIGVAYGLDSSAQIESVLVYQHGQQVQSLPVCTTEHVPNAPPLGSLNMADMNFDGYYDLLLQTTGKDHNFNFCVWLYNPKTQRFDASPALSALVNPRPNAKDRTVTAFVNQGCLGGCHETRTFKWNKGQLQLVRIVTQTQMQMAPASGPGCLYILTVQESRKGKMVQVSSDRVDSAGSKVCY